MIMETDDGVFTKARERWRERERERPNKSFYYGDITLGCVSAFDIRRRHFSFISFCKRAQVKSVVDAGGERSGEGEIHGLINRICSGSLK